jgi:hypothetical protein
LREGWPVCVKLDPLSDALILENIKSFVFVSFRAEEFVDEPSRKFALGLLFGSFDESEERESSDMPLNISKDLFHLLIEPLFVE